jgi:RNA polymerase sigma-70 factor (ECF subfamily)
VALNHFRDEKRTQNNISLDMQDAAQLRREAFDQAPLVEDLLVREVALRQIRRAVGALPAKQRAAVIMHKYEGMDYVQISGVLGCSPSAVKALMFRAYETLRTRLRSLQTV